MSTQVLAERFHECCNFLFWSMSNQRWSRLITTEAIFLDEICKKSLRATSMPAVSLEIFFLLRLGWMALGFQAKKTPELADLNLQDQVPLRKAVRYFFWHCVKKASPAIVKCSIAVCSGFVANVRKFCLRLLSATRIDTLGLKMAVVAINKYLEIQRSLEALGHLQLVSTSIRKSNTF